MMSEVRDEHWARGNRAAWVRMLETCIRELGIEDPDVGQARWVSEREDTNAKLRELAEEYGLDSNWPEDLHLADVVEKWIWKRLPEPEKTDG